jgi:hypothetical protein
MAEALQSCRAILAAARSIGNEPSLIAALVRYAGNAMTVGALEHVLAQAVPPADELRAMQELLEREIDNHVFYEALRGERGGYDQLLDTLQKRQVTVSTVVGGKGNSSWEDWIVGVFPAVITHGRAEQLRLMNEAVAAAKLPRERQGEAFKQIEDKIRSREASVVVRMLMPALTRISTADFRIQAQMRCALVGLAAERYRLAHGRWPESPGALVKAGLLASVPVDPFDGRPLRLKLMPDGLLIYSVGMDGIDNGGLLNRENLHEVGTDLGFQLWDPDARRQPALPPPPDEAVPP